MCRTALRGHRARAPGLRADLVRLPRGPAPRRRPRSQPARHRAPDPAFGLRDLVTTQLLDRCPAGFGHRLRAVTGLTVVPPAVPWLTRLHEGSGRTAGVPEPMTPLGIGGGLAVVPVSPTLLTATRRENRGVAPGLLQAAPTVGATVGPALPLIPYNRAGGGPGAAVPAVFGWSAGIAGLSLPTGAACWYLPGRPAREEASAVRLPGPPRSPPPPEPGSGPWCRPPRRRGAAKAGLRGRARGGAGARARRWRSRARCRCGCAG